MRSITALAIVLASTCLGAPQQDNQQQVLFTSDRAVRIHHDQQSSPVSVETIPHFPRPPMPPIIIDMPDKTIAEILNNSLHHNINEEPAKDDLHAQLSLALHRMAFLVNISDAPTLKETLANPEAHLTFLAPDDRALTPPEHRGPPPHHGHPHPPHHGHPHHHHDHDHHGPPGHHRGPSDHHHHHHPAPPSADEEDMWGLIQSMNAQDSHPFHSKRFMSAFDGDNDDDDKRREEFRQKIKKFIGFVLRYHLIDTEYTAEELGDKSTIASDLYETRIRVEPRLLPVPQLIFNFYAHTTGLLVKAKNGRIFVIDAPLLPPLPVLETLFVFPGVFSTLTSGVQKADLDLNTFRHHEDSMLSIGDGDDDVSVNTLNALSEVLAENGLDNLKSFTVFAPTNFAFKKLGWKLNAFLFSPFGKRVLKAVLAYHVVPDVVFYSDFNINATSLTRRMEVLPNAFIEGPREPGMQDLIEAGLVAPSCRRAHHKCKGRRSQRKAKRNAILQWLKSFWTYSHSQSLQTFDSATNPPEVKVTSYRLKTLFNDTLLPVDVFEYRSGLLHKGPLRRAIWISAEEGRKPGSEVKVVAPDVVAFKGAIHVVNSVIRPPMPEGHGDEGHHHMWDSEK